MTSVQQAFADQLSSELVAAPLGDAAHDFTSLDGRVIVAFKTAVHGVRDLFAAALQLAVNLQGRADVADAVLVAHLPRLSAERVEHEWRRLNAALHPGLAGKLRLVALASDHAVLLPHADGWLQTLASAAQEAIRTGDRAAAHDSSTFAWTAKGLAVWSVLTDAWLRCEPALSMQAIRERSGCSYPTVRCTVDYLDAKGECESGRSRSRALRGFPRRSLEEILAATDKLRQTKRFSDRTGRPADPQGLARRLLAKRPAGVVLGGVMAARFYMPDFDLNGLPRLDVSAGGDSSAFVRALDPALEAVGPDFTAPVLVMHRSLRILGADQPFAPPSDVLLDLCEQRLTQQAFEFANALRKGANG